jgi:RNA polymerase sigma-70 factor, ECF subfamily
MRSNRYSMAAVIPAVYPAVAPSRPDDDTLLNCFQAGERAALEELFERYRLPAFRVAFRLLNHEADALDAVQEGFVKALTHLGGFQKRSTFKTWLLRVVSNAALDLGRQRGRRECLSLEAASVNDDDLALLLVPDESAVTLARAELRQLLDQALRSLSDAQRQTFVLHAEAELSYREVAEAMSVSIGTVMSRLFYARQKLRAFLAHRLGSLSF